jgi:radical SAM protein with 4Fe4S-binding SPASM domain
MQRKFLYDLAIEPDGNCTFNANQTGEEASLGSRTINVQDPLWAAKVMYENKREENNKLSLEHPKCDQCEYMRYCNAGWYHYKIHDQGVIRQYDREDCSGYKLMWDVQKEILGDEVKDVSVDIHRNVISRIQRGALLPQERGTPPIDVISEESLPIKYNDYFDACSEIFGKCGVVLLTKKDSVKSQRSEFGFMKAMLLML